MERKDYGQEHNDNLQIRKVDLDMERINALTNSQRQKQQKQQGQQIDLENNRIINTDQSQEQSFHLQMNPNANKFNQNHQQKFQINNHTISSICLISQISYQVQEFNHSLQISDCDDQNNDQDINQNADQNNQNSNRMQFRNGLDQKHNVIKSMKYLQEIFMIQLEPIVVATIITFLTMAAQLNYQIDTDSCELQKMSVQEKQNGTNLDCPIDSYFMIRIRNIMTLNQFYIMGYLMAMNIYQFKQRKLVQYIFSVVLILYLILQCIRQSLIEISVVNEFTALILLGLVIGKFVSRHNWMIVGLRFINIAFYGSIMMIIAKLNGYIRDSRDFYYSMLFQHTTFIVKRVSQIYLKNRLIDNLQYDDISINYIMVLVLEYVFIFDYLLIQQNSILQQAFAVINFMLIQTENILNVHPLIELCEYIKNKFQNLYKDIVAVQYFALVAVIVYGLVSGIIYGSWIYFLIFVALKIFSKLSFTDNQQAQDRQQYAVLCNKYNEQKISQQQINHFTSQQSIIAFQFFFLYQLILIIVYEFFPENSSFSNQFIMVYQFRSLPNNNLSLLNVIVFNLFIITIVFVLVLIKSKQKLEVVKQPTQYQVKLLQIVITIGLLCTINKGLFETPYMRQNIVM